MPRRKQIVLNLIIFAVLVNAIPITDKYDSCNPKCSQHGKCISGICLCSNPYSGDTCNEKLNIEFKLTRFQLIASMLLTTILSALLLILLRMCIDNICTKKQKEFQDDDKPISIKFN